VLTPRPGRNVQLDVEQHGKAREQRGQEVGPLRRDRTLANMRNVLGSVSRVRFFGFLFGAVHRVDATSFHCGVNTMNSAE
jgi:hypothetical protein